MDVPSQRPSHRNHSPSSAEPLTQIWNYEATVKEIEATIAQIESGELDLAALFDRFEIAVHQLRECETFLLERQRQIDLLIETLSEEPES